MIKALLLVCSAALDRDHRRHRVALIRPVIDFFREVPFGDFFATEGEYAVVPLVAGTLMVTLIALLVAVPLGPGRGDVPL